MAKQSILVTQDRLKELFSYSPETGEFTRLRGMKGQAAGKRAGHLCKFNGYRSIRIDEVAYYEHRLAWLYMTGAFCPIVDHRNLDRSDNRWANLRSVTAGQNSINHAPKRRRHDAPRGVHPYRDRFHAKIGFEGRYKHLGTYDTPEEASAVYLAEARRLYGEFFPV